MSLWRGASLVRLRRVRQSLCHPLRAREGLSLPELLPVGVREHPNESPAGACATCSLRERDPPGTQRGPEVLGL